MSKSLETHLLITAVLLCCPVSIGHSGDPHSGECSHFLPQSSAATAVGQRCLDRAGMRNLETVLWEVLLCIHYKKWKNSEMLVQLLSPVPKNDLFPRLLECSVLFITLMTQNQSAQHGFPRAVWWQSAKLVWNRYFSIGYQWTVEVWLKSSQIPIDGCLLLHLLPEYWENLLRADAQSCVLLVKGENSSLWRVLSLRKEP